MKITMKHKKSKTAKINMIGCPTKNKTMRPIESIKGVRIMISMAETVKSKTLFILLPESKFSQKERRDPLLEIDLTDVWKPVTS